MSGQNSQLFKWHLQCFICAKQDSKKKGTKLTKVSQKSNDNLRRSVLAAAKIREDDAVLCRLSNEQDLASINAQYHMLCYQTYTNKRALESQKKCKDPIPIQDKVAKETLEAYENKLTAGELILFPVICTTYREILARETNSSEEELALTKSAYIKLKIQKIAGDSLVFYSHNGKPDVVCSSSLSIGGLFHELIEARELNDSREGLETSQEESVPAEVTLHKAAGILRTCIEELPSTFQYPLPSEVSLEASKAFVPIELHKFMSWLINKDSFASGDLVHDSKSTERRILTLAECIIYCSRKGKDGVIPPFHYGFMLQMFHEFGSRKLIEILHANGFCASYDELRCFLTAAAEHELSQNSVVHVPSSLIHRSEGGAFIQEGDDNVDINAETLDGKNTYHSMARVLFQNQIVGTRKDVPRMQRQTRRSIGPEYDASIFNLIPFHKSPIRHEPQKFQDAVGTVDALIERYNSLPNQDLAWVLLRSVSRGILNDSPVQTQVIPSWSVWNSRFADPSDLITTTHYTPPINSKPSDMTTVYTTLKKGQELTNACGQKYQVHTFDQQLYAVAQQIKFARPDEFSTLTVGLGPFHSACTFISCIGKLWGDSGLCEMLEGSGVYASNTTNQMLQGKQFNRAVRGLTMCYEVLTQLMVENFLEWLKCTDRFQDIDEIVIESCILAREEFSSYSFSKEDLEKLVTDINDSFTPLLNEFRREGCSKSPTFQHWDSCLTALQLLLHQLRAVRESNWDLHMMSQAAVLPYYFSCDRQNYARWAPVYVLEMALGLPDEVRTEFEAGNFSVKLTQGAFKGLAGDMAVEMSVIKDSKGDGGIIGLTSRDSTILRWSVTRNLVGAYASEMDVRCDYVLASNPLQQYSREARGKTTLTRDEADVSKMLNYVKSHMSDPFSASTPSDALINIGTGRVASKEIQKSLIEAIGTGYDKMNTFIASRLDKNYSGPQNFYDPITQTRLKTFADLKKKTTLKINGKVCKKDVSPEIVYQRALAIAGSRMDIDLALVLSFPLTSVPSALFKDDGSRRTTTKSDLLHALEKEVGDEVVHQLPIPIQPSIVVIDGMALLQSMNTKLLKVFNDVGNYLIKDIGRRLETANEVHLIFDRYDTSSLTPKQEERMRRYGTGGVRLDISGARPIVDFKKVLANDENKSQLTHFLCTYISEYLPKSSQMVQNAENKVYLAGGLEPREEVYVVSTQAISTDSAFTCNHIEADTRIVFHVMQIQNERSPTTSIVIDSPDTDVFVLLTTHYEKFLSKPEIWFHTGKISPLVDQRRYIPIHKLATTLGVSLSSALLSLHALTGCDTTSALYNMGKKTALSAVKKMTEEDLTEISNFHRQPSESATKTVTTLLARMYDPSMKSKKADRTDVNSLRYHLAMAKNSHIDRLPPSRPALIQHVLRASWQMHEWSQAHLSYIETVDCLDYGWLETDGVLHPKYFEGDTAMELLQKYFCSCRAQNACSTETCACLNFNLTCCNVCLCSEFCRNQVKIPDEELSD